MPIVGVNSRNLHDLTIDPGRMNRLIQQVPADRIAVAESGIEAAELQIEISERGVLTGDNEVLVQLQELKGLGINLSIDDFGTGYSSLNYLKRFPIDVVKIDRSFLRDFPTQPNDTEIVSSGFVLVSNDASHWHVLLRNGDINREGPLDVRNSLTPSPLELSSIDITHSRPVGKLGWLDIGVGYEQVEDTLTGEDTSDARGFITWRSN